MSDRRVVNRFVLTEIRSRSIFKSQRPRASKSAEVHGHTPYAVRCSHGARLLERERPSPAPRSGVEKSGRTIDRSLLYVFCSVHDTFFLFRARCAFFATPRLYLRAVNTRLPSLREYQSVAIRLRRRAANHCTYPIFQTNVPNDAATSSLLDRYLHDFCPLVSAFPETIRTVKLIVPS